MVGPRVRWNLEGYVNLNRAIRQTFISLPLIENLYYTGKQAYFLIVICSERKVLKSVFVLIHLVLFARFF